MAPMLKTVHNHHIPQFVGQSLRPTLIQRRTRCSTMLLEQRRTRVQLSDISLECASAEVGPSRQSRQRTANDFRMQAPVLDAILSATVSRPTVQVRS